ncbi:MAG: protoporphyrinogen oxidase [Desertimonas sp.]
MSPRVIIVGAGIAGLTAALRLSDAGVSVEVREAEDRVGGKLRATPFAGRTAVDEGADAFLRRVRAGIALAGRVGLGGALTAPEPAHAAVWHDGLHDLPAALALGVPTDVMAIARSGLLSWRGKARAALEPLLPATDRDDDSIGMLIRARFGNEVQERLVDALVGSIYGADTDRFSLAMVPQLDGLARRGRSLLLNGRRQRTRTPPSTGPVFAAPIGGMASLATATAEAARRTGATIRTGAPVTELARDGGCWRVDGEPVDAVVLATPARPTGTLVGTVAAELGGLLGAMDHASVVIVTVAVTDWPERLHGRSGYLVPKPVQRTVTAASFGSQKWAHWAGDDEVLRISLGRDGLPVDHLDDDTLVDRALTEVGGHLGVTLQPSAVRVSRWPGAFPQYRPHHRQWLRAVAAATPPGLHLTGASYDGIGVPACIAHADRVAGEVLRGLDRPVGWQTASP